MGYLYFIGPAWGPNKDQKSEFTGKVFRPSRWKIPRTLWLKNKHFLFQKFYNPAYKLYLKYMYIYSIYTIDILYYI